MSIEVYDEETHHHGKGHRSGMPGQTRPVAKRHVPFAALFLVAFVLVPILETASWILYLISPGTGILAA